MDKVNVMDIKKMFNFKKGDFTIGQLMAIILVVFLIIAVAYIIFKYTQKGSGLVDALKNLLR